MILDRNVIDSSFKAEDATRYIAPIEELTQKLQDLETSNRGKDYTFARQQEIAKTRDDLKAMTFAYANERRIRVEYVQDLGRKADFGTLADFLDHTGKIEISC